MFMASKCACYMSIDTLLPFTYSSLLQWDFFAAGTFNEQWVWLRPRVSLVDYPPLGHFERFSQVSQSGSFCFLLKVENLPR